MLRQEAPVDGFKRRAGYKRSHSRTGPVYNWLGRPEGIVMKLMIGLIGDNMAQRTVSYTRDFKGNGATRQRLHGELLRLCPWASEVYRMVTGRDLTDKVVYDRYHKMYYTNGPAGQGGVPEQSVEHYLRCPRLKPHLTVVGQMFLAGRPITLDEAKRAASTLCP